MIENLLKELQKNSSTASSILAIQRTITQSRLYEFLREVGRSKEIRPGTPNYMEVQAMQTAWSVGYNQCLDDIMNFRERFLEADIEKNPPIMSFGGLDVALYKDDLTTEEVNAIRNSKPIPKLTTRKPSSSKPYKTT